MGRAQLYFLTAGLETSWYNSYAHDARHGFLNWSTSDSGAFGYIANSWGYTYGAALEWYRLHGQF